MSRASLTNGAEAFARAYLEEAASDFQRLIASPGKPKFHPVFLEALEKDFVKSQGLFGELPEASSSVARATKAAASGVDEGMEAAEGAAAKWGAGVKRAIAGGVLIGILDALAEGVVDVARMRANRAKIEAAIAIGLAAVTGVVYDFWTVAKTLPETDLEGPRRKKRTREKRYRRHWRSRRNT